MLANRTFLLQRTPVARNQRGVVMVVALIVLVVMTLGGIALMRSMDTSGMIAGNMAFKQAATQSADTGIESAIAWIEQSNGANTLGVSNSAAGYSASTGTNANYPLGSGFWAAALPAGVCNLNKFGQGCTAAPEANANGNQVSYMIQRLCPATGAIDSRCSAVAGTVSAGGQNEGAGEETLSSSSSLAYYRITVRVVGPRNSISYVQSIVYL